LHVNFKKKGKWNLLGENSATYFCFKLQTLHAYTYIYALRAWVILNILFYLVFLQNYR
jgi:hypothetical protein